MNLVNTDTSSFGTRERVHNKGVSVQVHMKEVSSLLVPKEGTYSVQWNCKSKISEELNSL